ncbi:unnamed protein product [Adineta steineri]|uniref:RING-type domain-containing protein n=1 Tax=Adineta steineri TaxID=433720 RepID=A0A814E7H6_9BILA|nr:unnamed protein product [Adineta steineri]CAF0932163.1 unnamed protein product [Adineta steineri]CAF0964122.1 unnamed protein product [Adineta steineri]CAF1054493.1 unnamed protein product [Adineta steineri]CAF1088751.1 unnamed protein product [Adineta steineri]
MVRIAILGCGTMGLKIAGNFAYYGHIIKIFDSDLKQLDSACDRIHHDEDQLYRDGLIEMPKFLGQILCLNRLEDAVKDVEFIFECIIENIELKQALIEKAAQFAPAGVIICSNTMRLDLDKISENLSHKENFVGARFLFPVYYVPEVELNPSNSTSTQTIGALRKLLEEMDKVLYFRSSSDPLILDEEQREVRRKARVESLKKSSGIMVVRGRTLPELTSSNRISHGGARSDLIDHGNNASNNSLSNENVDCSICMDRPRNSVIRSCNHFVTCYECARLLYNRKDPCPVCRKRIDDVIRVYT